MVHPLFQYVQEADFFYVPVYTNLVIIPVTGWTDGPYYYSPGALVVHCSGYIVGTCHGRGTCP